MDKVREILEAVEEHDTQKLFRVYAEAVMSLLSLESEMLRRKLSAIDFQARTAIEKQELKLLSEDAQYREIHEKYNETRAIIRMCQFAFDVIKLDNPPPNHRFPSVQACGSGDTSRP